MCICLKTPYSVLSLSFLCVCVCVYDKFFISFFPYIYILDSLTLNSWPKALFMPKHNHNRMKLSIYNRKKLENS